MPPQIPRPFGALVLIDPVIFPKKFLWRFAAMKILGFRSAIRPARMARRRKRIFKDKQTALRRFAEGRGIFKSWSKDFIEAYLECGLLEKDTQSAILKCDPELEAQIFESGPPQRLVAPEKDTLPGACYTGRGLGYVFKAGGRRHQGPEAGIRTAGNSTFRSFCAHGTAPGLCPRHPDISSKTEGPVTVMRRPTGASIRRDGCKPRSCINVSRLSPCKKEMKNQNPSHVTIGPQKKIFGS